MEHAAAPPARRSAATTTTTCSPATRGCTRCGAATWPRCCGRPTTPRSTASSRRRRARRSTPTPTRSRSTPSTPAPRCCSSTTCCGPRTSRRTSTTSATRCRCTAPRPSTTSWSPHYPACKVSLDDLGERQLLHRRQHRGHPAPRRGVHRDQGRLMATTTGRRPPTGPEAPARRPRRSGCGPGCCCPARCGCRCSSSPRSGCVVLLSFGTTDALGNPRLQHHARQHRATSSTGPTCGSIVRSLVYAGSASAICLLISYPVAYVSRGTAAATRTPWSRCSSSRSSPTTWCGCTAGRRCSPTRAW